MDSAEVAAQRSAIVATFNRYDVNKDGLISPDELLTLMTSLDETCTLGYKSLDNLLKVLDRNGDGLVDIEEFIDWAMSSFWSEQLLLAEQSMSNLEATHVFMTPEAEASMERLTMWELRKDENAKILAGIGLALDDQSFLVMSVGSSSTQVYDARGDWTKSFATGVKVRSAECYKDLTAALIERKVAYERVLLINAIGYQLSDTDPQLLSLADLAARSNAAPTTRELLDALVAALPKATLQVYNRAKDPATKRYKYAQIINDFSIGLADPGGVALCIEQSFRSGKVAERVHHAIVDWGGGSFKVYVDGKRIATEIMDANSHICENGVVDKDRLSESIRKIKLFVARLLPGAKVIFIAQTGRTRELAIKEGLVSHENPWASS